MDADRLTLDPHAADAAITPKHRALLPVHLYGQAADMTRLMAIAARHNLRGGGGRAARRTLATCDGRPVGTIGVAGAFSFYPTKNLGALGDGGAVITNDAALAARIERLRNGGQTSRYHHAEPGVEHRGWTRCRRRFCGRRLPFLPGLDRLVRRALAGRYRRAASMARRCTTPAEVRRRPRLSPVPRPHEPRAALQEHLRAARHRDARPLPRCPIPRQPALPGHIPRTSARSPTARATKLLSLPLYPRADRSRRDGNRRQPFVRFERA